MKDLKFKKLISGLGGADCIICETKQEDWSNEEKIIEGFQITRTNIDTITLYQELVDDRCSIKKRAHDFDIRKGLTKQPLTTSDQHSITITHSYINVTSWFLKILYRINSETFIWEESKEVVEPIREGKKKVFQMIVEQTGMILDVVCSGGAKGGTATDATQGRRFHSEE